MRLAVDIPHRNNLYGGIQRFATCSMQQRDRPQRRIVFPERTPRMILAITPHISLTQGSDPYGLVDFKERAKTAVNALRKKILPTKRIRLFITQKTHVYSLQSALSKMAHAVDLTSYRAVLVHREQDTRLVFKNLKKRPSHDSL